MAQPDPDSAGFVRGPISFQDFGSALRVRGAWVQIPLVVALGLRL